MTREEAIKVFSEKEIGKHWHADWLDKFVALGMLKFDEPKSALEKFEELAIKKHDWLPATDSASILHDVRELLRDANLQITEK